MSTLRCRWHDKTKLLLFFLIKDYYFLTKSFDFYHFNSCRIFELGSIRFVSILKPWPSFSNFRNNVFLIGWYRYSYRNYEQFMFNIVVAVRFVPNTSHLVVHLMSARRNDYTFRLPKYTHKKKNKWVEDK